MARHLHVVANGSVMGTLTQTDTGALEFRYEDRWREGAEIFPLSLSMPLALHEHTGPHVRAFVDGLLPDNQDIRRRWGRRFGVSAGNPFALLEHMGIDCPGALQFLPAADIQRVLDGEDDDVVWHSEAEIGEMLRDLVAHRGVGRPPSYGAFSLAGAQPKTAFIERDGRWGTPQGRIPTTHILKPPADAELEGFEVNEHYCLVLAEELDMDVAASRVMSFDGEPAIVVTRYDRVERHGSWPGRVHQEDLCQAMGVAPNRKYEAEGGPGMREILRLISDWSDEPENDRATLLESLALSWVIGGSDAHAKNYAFLHTPGERVGLAPLYDIISVLPYPRLVPEREVKLAMRVGREYALGRIGQRQWTKLAEMCDLEVVEVLDLVGDVVASIPAANERAWDRVAREGLEGPFTSRLRDLIQARAERCLAALS